MRTVHIHIDEYTRINPEVADLIDAAELHALDCPDCKAIQIATGDSRRLCTFCFEVQDLLF